MNTQHLQYIIEIEHTRSISQAAENLYIGQPNLSRILHDMEDRVGFPIFERTSRGVHPTPRGTVFLRHAQNILREANQIENLGAKNPASNQLRLCIPRSGHYLEEAAQYLAQISPDVHLKVSIRECHVQRTLELLKNADAEMGVVRYRREYHDYFREQAQAANLCFKPMQDFQYQLVMSEKHPLARYETIMQTQLKGYTEITHGNSALRVQNIGSERTVHAVDRMAQFTLLNTVPGSFIWICALSADDLARFGLRQIPCSDNQEVYRDTLAYPRNGVFTALEQGLLQYLTRNLSAKV